jgi:hypothetical protein
MTNHESRWSSDPLNVHAKDCGIAIIVLGATYALGGEAAMVLLVYCFSVSVVLLLLLSLGLSGFFNGSDDDDYC